MLRCTRSFRGSSGTVVNVRFRLTGILASAVRDSRNWAQGRHCDLRGYHEPASCGFFRGLALGLEEWLRSLVAPPPSPLLVHDPQHLGAFQQVAQAPVDLARGEVSWVSPIARALMKAEAGDVVELRTPNGARRIEVLRIVYEEG